ncbi:hypothetical protein AKJ09_02494 [Labilithrix luteola]|uniref:Uncharacterized protein n=1 Tax=Labilithrix luteola TaxID=1391654 RepID=A0A0K1PQL3_9BACT|nr:hypothetical protein AKJ09_02494 [Labilithrix luteola]
MGARRAPTPEVRRPTPTLNSAALDPRYDAAETDGVVASSRARLEGEV